MHGIASSILFVLSIGLIGCSSFYQKDAPKTTSPKTTTEETTV